MSENKKSSIFVLHSESPVEELEPGIKRQFLGFNEKIMATKIWFDEGAVGQIHTHPHSQVTYVESGRFEVTIGDEVKMVSAGDSYLMESNVPHGAKCLASGVLIDVFTPIREDFLE